MTNYIELFNYSFGNAKLSDLYEKYKSSPKANIMNTIFRYIETLDHVYVSSTKRQEYPSGHYDKNPDAIGYSSNFSHNIMTLFLNEKGEISAEKLEEMKKIIGVDFTENDLKNAFEDILLLQREDFKREADDNEKKKAAKFPDVPKTLIWNLELDDKTITPVDYNGETVYEVEHSDGSKDILDVNGKYIVYDGGETWISKGLSYFEMLSGADKTITGRERTLMNPNNGDDYSEPIETITEFENGLVIRESHIHGDYSERFGCAVLTMRLDENDKPYYDSIALNSGLPNEAKMVFERDENGKIKDLKMDGELTQNPNDSDTITGQIIPPINIDDREKQTLIKLLNSDASMGIDFEIKINGNKIEVFPIIKNKDGSYVENIPQSLKDDVTELWNQGLKVDVDFNLCVNDDGSLRLDFQSQKSRNYEGDEKFIDYSLDGKAKRITKTDGNTVEETTIQGQNQTVKISNRNDEFFNALMLGDFKRAGELLGDIDYQTNDFEFYEICEKYENLTGKNLMRELLENDPYENLMLIKRLTPTYAWDAPSGIAAYAINPISQIDPVSGIPPALEYYNEAMQMFKDAKSFNPYSSSVAKILPNIEQRQNISDTKYTQRVDGKNYTVELKDNFITVNCDGKTYKLDLSNIPKTMQKYYFNSSPVVLYRIAQKGIKLDKVDDGKATQNGGYYCEENLILLNAQTLYGSKIGRTLAHETGHSLYTKFTQKNEKLEASFAKEKTAWLNSNAQYKNSDLAYCTIDIYEFVAEAYCLLTTGNAKSAYTLCNYFPETLELVKQMIEAEI